MVKEGDRDRATAIVAIAPADRARRSSEPSARQAVTPVHFQAPRPAQPSTPGRPATSLSASRPMPVHCEGHSSNAGEPPEWLLQPGPPPMVGFVFARGGWSESPS